MLYVGGSQVPLRVLGVDASKAGELPVLAVEESSRDGRFELRTEYRLAPRRDYVELSTVVTNLSDKKLSGVQVGDRGRWPGTPAFAPRLGHVQLATRADVPWIGRQGRCRGKRKTRPASRNSSILWRRLSGMDMLRQ